MNLFGYLSLGLLWLAGAVLPLAAQNAATQPPFFEGSIKYVVTDIQIRGEMKDSSMLAAVNLYRGMWMEALVGQQLYREKMGLADGMVRRDRIYNIKTRLVSNVYHDRNEYEQENMLPDSQFVKPILVSANAGKLLGQALALWLVPKPEKKDADSKRALSIERVDSIWVCPQLRSPAPARAHPTHSAFWFSEFLPLKFLMNTQAGELGIVFVVEAVEMKSRATKPEEFLVPKHYTLPK